MKNSKRIIAIAGIVILVSLYLLSLIFAILNTPLSNKLFKVSIFCTIAIPIFIYVYNMLCRVFRDKDNTSIDKDNKSEK
ncbi:MAG TPA: hypothetical protein VHQ24_06695 [Lachnospiraceae bacterium]|nr:hypothetical protein [Lachnospiraceae bacterium]